MNAGAGRQWHRRRVAAGGVSCVAPAAEVIYSVFLHAFSVLNWRAETTVVLFHHFIAASLGKFFLLQLLEKSRCVVKCK